MNRTISRRTRATRTSSPRARIQGLLLALSAMGAGCLPTLRPEGALPGDDDWDDWDAPRDGDEPSHDGPVGGREGGPPPPADASSTIDASPTGPDAGPPDAGRLPDLPSRTGAFRHRRAPGTDVVQTRVDATDYEAWRLLDLDTGLAVDDRNDLEWDLGFRRFFVVTNGGVSGPGTCAARQVDEAFDALAVAPAEGYFVDAPDIDEDNDTGPETAFNGGPGGERDWYDYTLATHTLSTRGRTYVVRTSRGAFVKMRLLSYYDGAGSPAVVTFEWAPLSPPPDAADATDGGAAD